MAFSEIELKRIDKSVGGLCRERSPAGRPDQYRIGYEVEGNSIVVFEERPRYDKPDELTKAEIAKFKLIRSKQEWKLYWMRRDLKWHAYDPEVSTSKALEPLVEVVAQDKWGAFFG